LTERPAGVVLRRLIDIDDNAILWRLLAKYPIVKARKNAHFMMSAGRMLCSYENVCVAVLLRQCRTKNILAGV
jgi:hypothetical protein